MAAGEPIVIDQSPLLTIPASHRDLLMQATVAMSTSNTDGTIQTTAIWVLLADDGIVRTSLAKARQKYRTPDRSASSQDSCS
jgi:hypothetical protein